MKRRPPAEDTGADALATLIIAATEDPAFRKRLLFILRLPQSQRAPLIKTAVDEMRLRGEPADIRAAFLMLADEESARTALRLLAGK
jgi:hypothetical protein